MAFRFESLEIWRRARAYAGSIYEVTGRFPRHEDYGLKSQLNRAVNSISLNITEGSGRGTNRAFRNSQKNNYSKIRQFASEIAGFFPQGC